MSEKLPKGRPASDAKNRPEGGAGQRWSFNVERPFTPKIKRPGAHTVIDPFDTTAMDAALNASADLRAEKKLTDFRTGLDSAPPASPMHYSQLKCRPTPPCPPELPHGRDGAVLTDLHKFPEPEFARVAREIAVHVIADTVGDSSLVLKLTRFVQLHDSSTYKKKMVYANECTKQGAELFGQKFIDTSNTKSIEIWANFKEHESLFELLDELTDFFTRILETSTDADIHAMTILFTGIREFVSVILNAPEEPKQMLRIYSCIIDAVFYTLEDANVSELLDGWGEYGEPEEDQGVGGFCGNQSFGGFDFHGGKTTTKLRAATFGGYDNRQEPYGTTRITPRPQSMEISRHDQSSSSSNPQQQSIAKCSQASTSAGPAGNTLTNVGAAARPRASGATYAERTARSQWLSTNSLSSPQIKRAKK